MKSKLHNDQFDKKELEAIISELNKVLEKNIIGDVVEFGCYLGGTSIYIADYLKLAGGGRRFYAYDSFSGLPEKSSQDVSPLGAQYQPGELQASRKQFVKNIRQAKVPMPIIKKAWFSELVATDLPNRVSFAFLDGDFYSSIKTSLQLIESNLSLGSTIIVDDYTNVALPGVAIAVDEWIKIHPTVQKRIEHSLAIIYLN